MANDSPFQDFARRGPVAAARPQGRRHNTERWIDAGLNAGAYVILFHVITAFGWLAGKADADVGAYAILAYGCYLVAIAIIAKNFGAFIMTLRSSPVIMAMLALAHFSILWSISPGTSVKFAVRLDFLFLMVIALSIQWSLAGFLVALRRIGVVLVILSGLLAVVAPSIAYDEFDHLRGLFIHKNQLGGFSATLAGVLLADFFWGTRSKLRLLEFVMCIAAIHMAKSATGVVILLTVTAINLFCWVGAGLQKMERVILICGMVFFVVLGMVAAIAIPDLLTSALDRSSDLTGRARVWIVSAQFIAQRPLFGYGYHITGGDNLVGRALLAFGSPFTHPHDSWLATGLQFGFAGILLQLVLYLGLTFNALKFWWNNPRRIEGGALISLMASIWLRSIPESDFFNIPSFEFAFFLLLAWQVYRPGFRQPRRVHLRRRFPQILVQRA